MSDNFVPGGLPVISDSSNLDDFMGSLKNRFGKLTEYVAILADSDVNNASDSEKFNIALTELHSLGEYFNYFENKANLKKLIAENARPELILMFEGRINTFKLWWAKLNKEVREGYGRMQDRQLKISPDAKPRLTIQQFNVMLNELAPKPESLPDIDKSKTVEVSK